MAPAKLLPDPSAAVFQPCNVYPVRVPAVVDSVTGVPAVIETLELVEPPLPLYDKVYELAVHFAYKVIDVVGE